MSRVICQCLHNVNLETAAWCLVRKWRRHERKAPANIEAPVAVLTTFFCDIVNIRIHARHEKKYVYLTYKLNTVSFDAKNLKGNLRQIMTLMPRNFRFWQFGMINCHYWPWLVNWPKHWAWACPSLSPSLPKTLYEYESVIQYLSQLSKTFVFLSFESACNNWPTLQVHWSCVRTAISVLWRNTVGS